MDTQYSFLTTLKKVWEAFLEIAGAILISIAPQILDVILEYLYNAPPETIHVPAQYAALWILVIRGFRNYWKNRNKT